MLTNSCYILCLICGKYYQSDVYNNCKFYTVIIIVNAVLHSFRGSLCTIFKHQHITRQISIIPINNETMAEIIDSLWLALVVFLVIYSK